MKPLSLSLFAAIALAGCTDDPNLDPHAIVTCDQPAWTFPADARQPKTCERAVAAAPISPNPFKPYKTCPTITTDVRTIGTAGLLVENNAAVVLWPDGLWGHFLNTYNPADGSQTMEHADGSPIADIVFLECDEQPPQGSGSGSAL